MLPRPLIVAAVVVLALAVRLEGVDWGLPHPYEEATPLKRAWKMAGWGEEPLDLNPHFFNYPSLTFYAHLGGQAALCGVLVASRAVDSLREFRVLYHTYPRAHYLAARLLSLLFALGTVFALARLPSAGAPAWVGPAAALLLAVNLFHVSRSQMIEVDVPLTAFVVVALALLARLADSPTRRGYIAAGVTIGLAASTKYTGALLVVPLAAAHLVARRSDPAAATWRRAVAALGLAAAAFVAASPFVVLDFASFRDAIALEQSHMRLGHFGGSGEAAALFYLRRLGASLVGWPVLFLAAAGVVIEALIRGRAWAVVAFSFAAAYAAAISSWETTADRYALPLVPVLLVFATAGAAAVIGRVTRNPRARAALAVVAVAGLAAPNLASVPGHEARAEVDSRTIAREWIERNVEPGSLVVTEAYGPELFGPLDFWNVPADIRTDVYRRRTRGGFRGVLPIPLFQAQPEDTAPYYDLGLYTAADVIITTSAIRGRYAADRARFPAQNAFYNNLDAAYSLDYTVDASGTGPRIFVYRNPAHARPFASRPAASPPALDGSELPARWRAWFYYRVGLNYEAFGHLQAALSSYRRGWGDTAGDSETWRQISYGTIRVLRLLHREAEIPGVVRRLMETAPTRDDADFLKTILATL